MPFSLQCLTSVCLLVDAHKLVRGRWEGGRCAREGEMVIVGDCHCSMLSAAQLYIISSFMMALISLLNALK